MKIAPFFHRAYEKKPPFVPAFGTKDGVLRGTTLIGCKASRPHPLTGNEPNTADCLKLSRASPVRAYWACAVGAEAPSRSFAGPSLPHLHLDAAL